MQRPDSEWLVRQLSRLGGVTNGEPEYFIASGGLRRRALPPHRTRERAAASTHGATDKQLGSR